jgi:KUP system potassium uptake protein
LPAYEDLIGALSLIIWTLTIMVSIKYVVIVLYADDEGEGGTFALYSLLSRYSNIMQRNPREPQTVKIERYMTKDMKRPNTMFRKFLEKSIFLRNLVKVLSVLGVSFVIAGEMFHYLVWLV